MRELKFRAWNKIRKIMSYDVTLYANGWVKCVFEDGTEDKFPPKIAKEILVIMQYIGLKDKNGKEIYEGDICETVTYSGIGTIDVVKFSGGAFKLTDIEDALLPIPLDDSDIQSVEVIGNIFQVDELRILLDKGWSVNKIANHFNVDWSTIRNRIYENPELLESEGEK